MFNLGNLLKAKQLLTASKKVIAPLASQNSFGSGHGHHEEKIKGRIKVSEKIVWINVVPPDGIPRRVAAFSGESLLDVIQRNNVPGIFPDCNGGDNELKPYQIPVDFYSAGVSCA